MLQEKASHPTKPPRTVPTSRTSGVRNLIAESSRIGGRVIRRVGHSNGSPPVIRRPPTSLAPRPFASTAAGHPQPFFSGRGGSLSSPLTTAAPGETAGQPPPAVRHSAG